MRDHPIILAKQAKKEERGDLSCWNPWYFIWYPKRRPFPMLSGKNPCAIICSGVPLGDRLMVGRETLDLVVRVRILLPQPESNTECVAH